MADAVHHAVLTAAVYYAGHGVSVEDENDLLPTGLGLRPASDLEIHGLSVSSILRQMKREERANVVMPIPHGGAGGGSNVGLGNVGEFFGGVARGVMRIR